MIVKLLLIVYITFKVSGFAVSRFTPICRSTLLYVIKHAYLELIRRYFNYWFIHTCYVALNVPRMYYIIFLDSEARESQPIYRAVYRVYAYNISEISFG